MKTARYWVSWWQPGEDYRPLNYPAKTVIAWWCSGEDEAGQASLCAVVDSPDEAQDVWSQLSEDWPEIIDAEKRFCDLKPNDWRPEPTRFPWPE